MVKLDDRSKQWIDDGSRSDHKKNCGEGGTDERRMHFDHDASRESSFINSLYCLRDAYMSSSALSVMIISPAISWARLCI